VYFVSADGSVADDGDMSPSAVPYAIDAYGGRHALPPDYEAALGDSYRALLAAQIQGRMRLGDVVARMTQAMGVQPCAPCKRRQEWLNRFGDRIARKVW
jgi:hypothetical protein